jgi:hypothetical protein
MNSKVFSERFNQQLILMDLPEDSSEKIKAVSKVFDISRHLANAIILGHMLPPEADLDRIAETLEVCPLWLSGKSDKKKAYTSREKA